MYFSRFPNYCGYRMPLHMHTYIQESWKSRQRGVYPTPIPLYTHTYKTQSPVWETIIYQCHYIPTPTRLNQQEAFNSYVALNFSHNTSSVLVKANSWTNGQTPGDYSCNRYSTWPGFYLEKFFGGGGGSFVWDGPTRYTKILQKCRQ